MTQVIANILNTIAKIFITSNPATAKELKPQHTVEAEYGDVCVEGSIQTLAHHGSRSHNPAPCATADVSVAGADDVIVVSHVDLDTLGGLGKLLGFEPCLGILGFWKLAEFVDVNGPHKLHEAEATPKNLEDLYAYWAWSQDNRVFAPRDGSALEITDKVLEHLDVLGCLLNPQGDADIIRGKELRAAGQAFKEAEEELNRESLKDVITTPLGDIAIRSAAAFTNHLYTTVDEQVCAGVLAFREDLKSVTVSFSEEQGNACEIMQKAFGPEAGGRKGIAGSPRDVDYAVEDLGKVVEQLNGWLTVTC
jgi:hypothetical protein